VRDADDLQTTITLSPVNRQGQALSLELALQMTVPMPDQDEHLPDRIEAYVHHAGLEVQRRLFRALIEKADQELVLQRRHGKGGDGIQCRGTRPYTFGSWAQIGADRTWCWPNHLQPSHLSDLAGGSAPIWAHEPKPVGFECFRKGFTRKELRHLDGRKPLRTNDLLHPLFSVSF
jgi:hypothetical protein